jgi:hypothetical protein
LVFTAFLSFAPIFGFFAPFLVYESSPFPLHPQRKITIWLIVDGAVIEKQLPGTEFLPPAYFLPWAAAKTGIFWPFPYSFSVSWLSSEKTK